MLIRRILIKHQEKSFILSDQLIVSGVNFLLSIFLARKLGIHLFGTFATIQLFQFFISSFHQALVITPLITIFPTIRNKTKRNNMISTLLFVNIILVGFIFFIAFLSTMDIFNSVFSKYNFSGYAVATYISTLITYEFIRKSLLTMKKYGKLIVVNSIAYILPLITMAALSLIYKLSLNSVLYILSTFFTLSFILGGLLIKSSITIKNVKKRILLNTWKFSKWLVGKAIVQWLSGNYFIVIAGLILGKNTIGVIRIVQNLFGVLNVLLMAIENYLAIKSSAIYSHNGIKPLVKFQYHVLLRISFFILFVLGAVSLFSQSIITTLYGVEYTEYYYLVYWFSILYVIIFLNLPNRFVLRTLLKTNVIFYSYVASTIFSLLFARPLINTYGIIGVVIGLIACQVIMFCWNQIIVFKYLNK